MSLTFEAKQAVIAEVRDVATNAQAAIAAEYSGLSVEQMTVLRSKAREIDVDVRVVKNSLARRAFEGTDFECLREFLKGPLLLVFSLDDPGAGARLVRDFSKDHEMLVPKVLSFGGDMLPAEELSKLANMPTLDGARASLLSLMKTPQSTLVRLLKEPGAKLSRVLSAYCDRSS